MRSRPDRPLSSESRPSAITAVVRALAFGDLLRLEHVENRLGQTGSWRTYSNQYKADVLNIKYLILRYHNIYNPTVPYGTVRTRRDRACYKFRLKSIFNRQYGYRVPRTAVLVRL